MRKLNFDAQSQDLKLSEVNQVLFFWQSNFKDNNRLQCTEWWSGWISKCLQAAERDLLWKFQSDGKLSCWTPVLQDNRQCFEVAFRFGEMENNALCFWLPLQKLTTTVQVKNSWVFRFRSDFYVIATEVFWRLHACVLLSLRVICLGPLDLWLLMRRIRSILAAVSRQRPDWTTVLQNSASEWFGAECLHKETSPTNTVLGCGGCVHQLAVNNFPSTNFSSWTRIWVLNLKPQSHKVSKLRLKISLLSDSKFLRNWPWKNGLMACALKENARLLFRCSVSHSQHHVAQRRMFSERSPFGCRCCKQKQCDQNGPCCVLSLFAKTWCFIRASIPRSFQSEDLWKCLPLIIWRVRHEVPAALQVATAAAETEGGKNRSQNKASTELACRHESQTWLPGWTITCKWISHHQNILWFHCISSHLK